MNQNINIEPIYRTNVILWAAFLMSQLMFLVIIFFTKRALFSFDLTKPLLGEEPVVTIIIGLMVIFNLGLSFYLKSQMTKQAIDNQSVGGVQSAAIVGYALCESISIFGLILAFVFDYTYFFAFAALAILGILLHFPKRDNFIAAVYKK